MTRLVQKRINLRDGHAFGSLNDPHYLVAGPYFSLFEDAKIEAGPIVRDEQSGHLRLAHPNADPVASNTRLSHLEQRASDTVTIAYAHLVVG